MSDIASETQLRKLIQEQGQALVDYVALIAAGKTDTPLEIPEGIEIMSDLAVALQYLAEDVADYIKGQNELLEELEERVQDRTQELESTLANLRRSQKEFVREEWNRYMQIQQNNFDNPEWMEADHFEATVLQAVEEKSPAFAPANGNQASALTLPINYADEIIGLLGFEGEDLESVTDEDLAALEDIAEQVGLALENQRLFDQTQLALTETQELYRISSRLNAAETPSEIIDALLGPLSGEKISLMRLWSITETESQEPWMELVSSWEQDPSDIRRAPGFRIPVSLFPTIESLLSESREVRLVSSVSTDPRTKDDVEFVTVTTDLGVESIAFLPLTLGTRLVGLISFGWKETREFTDTDIDRYTAIAAQVGTSLDSLRLLEETQLRASQLETLTEIESNLSFASNENEILQAIATHFPDSRVALHFFGTGEDLAPFCFKTVAAFEDESFIQPKHFNQEIDIESFPAYKVWYDRPNSVTSIPNLFEESSTSEEVKTFVEQLGFVSLAIIPLRSGRLWQGVLTVSWKDEHHLTQTEKFLLDQLREPLGAIVASNRAKIAEADARKETEELYAASRALNETGGQIDSIVEVLVELGGPIGFTEALLTLVQQDQTNHIIGNEVASYQTTVESTTPKFEVGQRFGRAAFEQIANLNEPYFIENVDAQTELTTASKKLIEKMNASSLAILPLRVGDQKIGNLFLISEKTLQFTDRDKRLFESLAPQIAVAVQNSQLFTAAQKKAEREEILRQITEKVRNTSDVESVMRTAVIEIGRLLNRKTFVYLKDQTEETGEHNRIRGENNNG